MHARLKSRAWTPSWLLFKSPAETLVPWLLFFQHTTIPRSYKGLPSTSSRQGSLFWSLYSENRLACSNLISSILTPRSVQPIFVVSFPCLHATHIYPWTTPSSQPHQYSSVTSQVVKWLLRCQKNPTKSLWSLNLSVSRELKITSNVPACSYRKK